MRGRPTGRQRGLSTRLARAVERAFDGVSIGELEVRWPDGRTTRHGDSRAASGIDAVRSARIELRREEALRRIATGGATGLGDAYVHGEWDTEALEPLLRLFDANRARLERAASGRISSRALSRLLHATRANTRRGSASNVAHHYDVGNDFYRRWLDEDMHYSAALFESPRDSLEVAQRAKLARVTGLLAPRAGDRTLEIGCGWGATARALSAVHGCRVEAISLSREQLRWARAHRAGEPVSYRQLDWRDVRGPYERIVSIEMLEAVGQRRWAAWFRALHAALVPGGRVVLQTITIEPERFARYRRRPDFIQRRVFPGGMLCTDDHVRTLARAAGLVPVQELHFGSSYATTLARWRERFESALPALRAEGRGEPFLRSWRYYLAYCEAGFRTRALDVGMFAFDRPTEGP